MFVEVTGKKLVGGSFGSLPILNRVNAYAEGNILIINVPANMTKHYQPLDLTVNGYAKRFFKSKFTE